MGRLKYKVFFCSFCLERDQEQVINDHSFNQSVDVSHLATPHIASNPSLGLSSNSTPVGDCSSTDSSDRNKHQQQGLATSSINNNLNQSPHPPDPPERRELLLNEGTASSHNLHQPHDHSPIQQSPIPSPPINIYELQPQPQEQQLPLQPQNQPQPSQRNDNDNLVPLGQNLRLIEAENQPLDMNGPATKLSYDIISVREPLAKILAERHQIQLAQLQQRQILGEHDYIEVYGERGSSCFYEEIAGSTTSSATYDQIGAISNHNYQVLINAYAVASRPNVPLLDDENNDNTNNHNNSSINDLNTNDPSAENVYDLTGSLDQVDAVASNSNDPKPSTSSCLPTNSIPSIYVASTSNAPIPSDRTSILSQSIPVYSVINKATRRSNAIIRATIDSCRPPQPPPKNLPMIQQQTSTSAIQKPQQQESSNSKLLNNSNNNQHGIKVSPQIPTTSSYNTHNSENLEPQKARLPQPPPRFSKLHLYNATNRPLPLPDNLENIDNNNKGTVNERGLTDDEDVESIDNGYELLSTNFDDDQIDVGYEKIRESNRYSGGSLSSQFCPLQAIDNGGYESVQPIYSSPSNALVEPNYEAIGPTTASELAAAATAKLTAAATVMEKYLKQDQTR